MIVTIDGPAGAGKSSAARALAARLGFEVLDTGAMYRAVALSVLRAGVDPGDSARLADLLANLRLEMPPGRVLLDGEDVTSAIRSPDVTATSSVVAAIPAVRWKLSELQRAIAAGRDMVVEGRDQGTVVFPDALCKFFLTADEEERLRRRRLELEAKGQPVDPDALRAAQRQRDERDAARDLAPMRPAEDGVVLDSTGLSLEEVVARMEAEVRRRATRRGV